MMKILQYFFKLVVVFVIVECSKKEQRISDKRLCVDPQCSVPISLARGMIRYVSDDERILSFTPGDEIKIFSKSAGSRKDLWGAEVRGKRGYVPMNLVKEYKMLNKDAKYEVPTQEEPIPVQDATEKPSGEQEPFYVVDGTTLYMPEDSEMHMTTNVETTPSPPPEEASQETSVDHTASVASPTPAPDDVTKRGPDDSSFVSQQNPSEPSAAPALPESEGAVSTPLPLDLQQPPLPPVEPGPIVGEENKPDNDPPDQPSVPDPVPQEENAIKEEEKVTETPVIEKTEAPSLSKQVEKVEGLPAEMSEASAGNEGSQEITDSGSVYEYLSDTLTGWMSGDGGGNEEEEEEEDDDEGDEDEEEIDNETEDEPSDTGQKSESEITEKTQDNVSEKLVLETNTSDERVEEPLSSKEPEIPEAPELIMSPDPIRKVVSESEEQPNDIDISKINLLSLKRDIDTSTPVKVETISAVEKELVTEKLQDLQEQESNLIDEILMQGQTPVTGAQLPIGSHHSMSGESANKQEAEKSEVQVGESTEHPPEETITPPSAADFEPPSPLDDQVSTTVDTPEEASVADASTPSPVFYEPSPTELPSQDTTESPITRDELGSSEEVNVSDSNSEGNLPQDESTTTQAAFQGSVEEITTAVPPAADTVRDGEPPVEADSGAYFASWVYNLFGYGGSEEASEELTTPAPEGTTAAPESVTEQLSTEAESAASSWWWGSSSTEGEVGIDETCKAGSCAEVGSEPIAVPEEHKPPHHHHQWPAEQEATVATMDWEVVATSGTALYLLVTAVTVLIFTLGHYYIEKMKRDGVLIAKINSLQKELLVCSRENLILKDDLEVTQAKLSGVEVTSSASTDEVDAIKLELEESQRAQAELEEQNAALEKELEAVTEAGLELNKMLSEFLSAQKGSEDLTKSVELLQQQLNKQQATISAMNQALTAKAQEAEQVQSELLASQARVSELELELAKQAERLEEVQKHKQQLTEDLEESCVTLANQLQEAAQLRESEVSGLKKQLQESATRLEELQESLRARSSELEIVQDSLTKLMKEDSSEEGQKKLQSMLDVSKAQAELKLITSERDVLKERLQCEEDARQLLEDHVKVIREEVEKLKERHELAEKEKHEAQTKLEVLSSYFKEKETQLQKELGLQEAMFVQKKEDVSNTHVRIKTLEDEIENYKAQNEALKQEIIDQERGLKSQITTLEKKAHENWIAARQAERKLDETKQEAGTLRNRLTMIEKGPVVAQNGEDGKPPQRLDANGELLPTSPMLHIGDSPSMSPPHLVGSSHFPLMPPPPLPGSYMPPPPPLEYLHSPPPPLPHYPDRRPPPLGRMSSPPPHHFSPPPTDRYVSPYRPRSPASDRSLPRYRYSSRSPSPPPYGHPDYAPYPPAARPWEESRAGFRPLRREKDNKGSTLSSGHSSESLEKSSRHSGGKS